MKACLDDFDVEPLSMDNPFDWQYESQNGFVDRVTFTFFGDYVRSNNLLIELWGVDILNGRPHIECNGISADVFEIDQKSHTAKVRLKCLSGCSAECHVTFRFGCDFYFTLFNMKSDGTLVELESDEFRDQ